MEPGTPHYPYSGKSSSSTDRNHVLNAKMVLNANIRASSLVFLIFFLVYVLDFTFLLTTVTVD